MTVATSYALGNVLGEFIDAVSKSNLALANPTNAVSPALVALADGGFALSYTISPLSDPTSYNVALDRYTIDGVLRPSGNIIGTSILMTSTPAGVTLSDPDSAQLSDGRIITTWTTAGSGIHYGIANPVTGVVTVFDTLLSGTDSADTASDVAALRTGGGFVVAKQDSFTASDQDADLLFYNSAGVVQASFTLGGNSSLDEQAPAVAVLTNGNVVVAYEKELTDNTDTFGMAIEIISATGTSILSPFNFDVSGTQNRHPQVLALSTGDFVVVYEDNESGGSGVSIAFFTEAGALRTIQRADPDALSDGYPSVSELANGFVVVHWTNSGVDIATSLFDPVTMALLSNSGLTQIENQTGQQAAATTVGLTDGSFVTAWSDFNNALADGNTDPDGTHVSLQIDRWFRFMQSDAAGDVMIGDELVDIMFGNGGNDTMVGEGGADQMTGGLGNDIYYVGEIDDVVTETAGAGSGSDFIYSSVTYTMAANTERLFLLTEGNINGTGRNGFADVLTGNSGHNILNGLTGNDVMRGGQGHDTYLVDSTSDIVEEATNYGTDSIKSTATFTMTLNTERLYLIGSGAIDGTGLAAKNDLIVGNNNANKINGLTGNDILTGGLGADVFLFNTTLNAATNHDTITDYNVAADTIQLENAIFTLLAATGTLASNLFEGTSIAGQNGSEIIIYDKANGDLYYDTNGAATAGGLVLFADVTNNTALTFADFVVV